MSSNFIMLDICERNTYGTAAGNTSLLSFRSGIDGQVLYAVVIGIAAVIYTLHVFSSCIGSLHID